MSKEKDFKKKAQQLKMEILKFVSDVEEAGYEDSDWFNDFLNDMESL